jgi:hypothetical protein
VSLGEQACPICRVQKPISAMSQLSCGHVACNACLRYRLAELLGPGHARVMREKGKISCSMIFSAKGCNDQLDQAFIQQHVSDEHYQALLTILVAAEDSLTRPEPLRTCPGIVCGGGEYPASETISLSFDCEHFLCEECLEGGLAAMLGSGVQDEKAWLYDDAYTRLKQNGGRIRCQMISGQDCNVEMHQQLIMRHVPKHLFERYLKMEVTGDGDVLSMVACPTCGNIIDIGHHRSNPFAPAVRCPYKRECPCPEFCSGCKQAPHEGMTCEEAANQRLADQAIEGLKMTTCPKCHAPCEAKTEESCDRADCPHCKFTFCNDCHVDYNICARSGDNSQHGKCRRPECMPECTTQHHEDSLPGMCKHYRAVQGPVESLISACAQTGQTVTKQQAEQALAAHGNDVNRAYQAIAR